MLVFPDKIKCVVPDFGNVLQIMLGRVDKVPTAIMPLAHSTWTIAAQIPVGIAAIVAVGPMNHDGLGALGDFDADRLCTGSIRSRCHARLMTHTPGCWQIPACASFVFSSFHRRGAARPDGHCAHHKEHAMGLTKQWITFGDNNAHIGYLAVPSGLTQPVAALIVGQEIWGVDGHIQNVVERLAAAGYAVLAPDLFAEGGKRPPSLSGVRVSEAQDFVNKLPDAHAAFDPKARAQALSAYSGDHQASIAETLDTAMRTLHTNLEGAWVATMRAAVKHMRTELPFTQGQRVGIVGFCMGGALAMRLAAKEPDLSAAVSFYGRPPSDALIADTRCPVLAFNGALDTGLTDSLPNLTSQMQAHHKVFESHVYAHAHHAFFNDNRPAYNVQAARDAYARTLMFLNSLL